MPKVQDDFKLQYFLCFTFFKHLPSSYSLKTRSHFVFLLISHIFLHHLPIPPVARYWLPVSRHTFSSLDCFVKPMKMFERTATER